jgi:hypothetical protein
MSTRVSELTVEELEQVVEKTVRRAMEDYLEDLEALRSDGYVSSIREAREDYASGDTVPLSDLKDD